MKQLTALAAYVMLALSANAGTLTPPAAPGPTMKTLDEVEARIPISSADIPLTINRPGSYYLTENITVNRNAITAISLGSGDVVLDLNGYTLRGPGAEVSNSGDGIRFNLVTSGTVVIKNGTVRDWGGDGIDMLSAPDIRISNVTSADNRIYGISMKAGRVSNCTLMDNGLAGVVMFGGYCSDNIFTDGNFGVVTSGSSSGLIAENVFQGQTSYAIRVNSGGFRIDKNTITGPGTGTGIFVALGSASLVTRNLIGGYTTAYFLHSSCTAGPIINLLGGTLTSESPWANFQIEP